MKGSWTTEALSSFEYGGGVTILREAERKSDEKLLKRIRGLDLFTCEAKYHKSCRTQYVQKPEKWRSKSDESKMLQNKLEETHDKAFSHVCEILENEVIKRKKVIKLNDLRKEYVKMLEATEFANPDYRGEKIKSKIEKSEQFKEKVSFCPLGDHTRFHSYIIFNRDTNIANAIKESYKLGSQNIILEAGIKLQRVILEAFSKAEETTWPPPADSLKAEADNIPEQLRGFLTILLCGKENSISAKVTRLVSSLVQDICKARTNYQWNQPKHILLGMTLRHLFRSAEIITLMNKLGHSVNYSFVLELETSIMKRIQQSSTLLSPLIIRNPSCRSLFHSDFDNFDKFVNELTGSGSVHTAHGIMLQELLPLPGEHIGGYHPELISVEKTCERSATLQHQESLAECYVSKRKSPLFQVHRRSITNADAEIKQTFLKNMLWIIAQFHSAKNNSQQVPGCSGFISKTGDVPQRLTTIDYFPVIPHLITEYATVQETLKYAEDATKDVNQKYVITTYDLGVCMKAFPIILNEPVKYKNHII